MSKNRMYPKCTECGGTFILTNVIGRKVPWKKLPAVEIEDDLEVLACDGCDEMMLSGKDIKLLDASLLKTVKRLGLE